MRPDVNSADNPQVPVPEGDGTEHPLVGRDPRSFPGQPVAQNSHGLRIPRIGLGTWQLDDDQIADIVPAALDIGYRHIDTAQMYGNEQAIGDALARTGLARDELFITTKVGNDNHRPGDLVRSVGESLDRLGTDHVDLLLVHWPVDWPSIGGTLAALTQVQASGQAHHIGVSNFTIDQLEQVGDAAPIEVVQVECHPFLQQRELRSWCWEHDLIVTAYSPLAMGQVLDDEELSGIGAANDSNGAGAAVAWLATLPGVVAIPRTSDPDHLVRNWQAGHIQLSPDERRRIENLDEGRRLVAPAHGPW